MGENEINAWQDYLEAHILAIENNLNAMRKELQDSIMGFYHNSRDTHQRIFDRIEDLNREIQALKVKFARHSPSFDDMKEHMRTDMPVDVARDKAIARGVFYVIGLSVSGFIGWLFSHLGARQ